MATAVTARRVKHATLHSSLLATFPSSVPLRWMAHLGVKGQSIGLKALPGFEFVAGNWIRCPDCRQKIMQWETCERHCVLGGAQR